jgi:hypothetical protein
MNDRRIVAFVVVLMILLVALAITYKPTVSCDTLIGERDSWGIQIKALDTEIGRLGIHGTMDIKQEKKDVASLRLRQAEVIRAIEARKCEIR